MFRQKTACVEKKNKTAATLTPHGQIHLWIEKTELEDLRYTLHNSRDKHFISKYLNVIN